MYTSCFGGIYDIQTVYGVFLTLMESSSLYMFTFCFGEFYGAPKLCKSYSQTMFALVTAVEDISSHSINAQIQALTGKPN